MLTKHGHKGTLKHMELGRLNTWHGRDVMHWFPVSQSILDRFAALAWRSVTGWSPSYLTDLCRSVSDLASRRALRSSARGELLIPRASPSLKLRRAFSVIGPSTWNELNLALRLLPRNNVSFFCKLLLRHFSLAVAGLRAPLSRFLEGAIYK